VLPVSCGAAARGEAEEKGENMYYLLNPETRRVLNSKEDIEELKQFVKDATKETEVKAALKSLGAVITTDVYPYLLH
jgi:hypothetical protein